MYLRVNAMLFKITRREETKYETVVLLLFFHVDMVNAFVGHNRTTVVSRLMIPVVKRPSNVPSAKLWGYSVV